MKVEKLGRLLFGLCAVASLPATAAGDEPAFPLPQNTADQARLQLASPLASKQTADSRYRHINGQWWYLLDDNRWARWDGAKWTVPSQKADAYQEWRRQQFSERYNRSEADDAEMRRREVARWRSMASPEKSNLLTQSNADYHKQMDRFHDTLMTTPYDYRIGTTGHGLFDCDPDRVIATSGRFNYATSAGGYMGGALRSPFGY